MQDVETLVRPRGHVSCIYQLLSAFMGCPPAGPWCYPVPVLGGLHSGTPPSNGDGRRPCCVRINHMCSFCSCVNPTLAAEDMSQKPAPQVAGRLGDWHTLEMENVVSWQVSLASHSICGQSVSRKPGKCLLSSSTWGLPTLPEPGQDKKGSSLEPLRGAQPCRCPSFGLLAPRTVRG